MTQPTPPALTDDQLAFFNAFGYVVRRNIFTPDELTTLRAEFDHMLAADYPHTPYDGSRRHWAMMMDEQTPFFASLMQDPRFLLPAQQMYGQDVLGICADANRYTGHTDWHRDVVTVDQFGVKYAFYLDPVDADSGALRVIPTSHRLPDDDAFTQAVRAQPLDQVPATALASNPGDVVAFDLRTFHASVGGSTDRPMCTVVYYANPRTPRQTEATKDIFAASVKYGVDAFGPKRKFLYAKSYLANPRKDPVRQAWIDRLTEIGAYEAPGVVEI